MHAAPTPACIVVAACVALLPRVSTARADDARVDFRRDVAPIFERHCHSCHGPKVEKSGLRLDRRARALAGGVSGPVIVPRMKADSRLYRLVAGLEAELRMPSKGPPLSAAEIQRLGAWIDSGAEWPDDGSSAVADLHWSFRPVVRPAPPGLQDTGWADGPIDSFILARLEHQGLMPSAGADRRTLIRRLGLDLLGLPPDPEDIAAFELDPRPNAFERLADRFLASPRLGERWARHWLDAVRFAETNGFETNTPRDNAWPYRDYVIRAFNEDRPYLRFVVEQIAGDQTGEESATGLLVGGPYDTVKSPDVVLTLEQRTNELQDMIHTTATAFLGLTAGCARCHDHKFDPISQRDYYGLQAIFSGVQHGDRELKAAADPEKQRRAADRRNELAEVEKRLWNLEPIASATENGMPVTRPAVSPLHNVDRFPPVLARRIRFTVLGTNSLEPCIDELEVFTAEDPPRNVALASAGARTRASSTYPNSQIHRLEHLNDGQYGNARSWISAEMGAGWVEVELEKPAAIDRIVWARDRKGEYKDRLVVDYRIEVAGEAGNWRHVATSADRVPPGSDAPGAAPRHYREGTRYSDILLLKKDLEAELKLLESKPRAYAGVFTEPAPVHILHRGDPMQPREAVTPGAIAAIGTRFTLDEKTPEAGRRAALARWITDPGNPLTGRVIVNRLWLHHFGEGIVATPSDFGGNGAPPSHPELLDWLASELGANGGSLKRIHRAIITSSAYRQSSRPRPEGLRSDASARLLWRFPPRRIEAETIRDAILSVAGTLDLRMGGPGFSAFEPNDNYVRVYEPKRDFGPAEWRRMIYQYKVRMQQDGVFGLFDCPDAGQVCPKRPRSTTALQSLNLLNSTFAVQQAKHFAGRARREAGGEGPRQARRAFRLALGREPDAAEITAAVALAEAHGLTALCRALFNANEFLFLE